MMSNDIFPPGEPPAAAMQETPRAKPPTDQLLGDLREVRNWIWDKSRSPNDASERERFFLAHRLNDVITSLSAQLASVCKECTSAHATLDALSVPRAAPIGEIYSLRGRIGVLSQYPTVEDDECEPLHTGDDERADLTASIIGLAKDIQGDEETMEFACGIIDDAEKLDRLIIQTIKRERSVLEPPAAAQPATELRTAVKALVVKLDEIIPIVDGYIAFSHVRSGAQYTGPNLIVELAEVKRLLRLHPPASAVQPATPLMHRRIPHTFRAPCGASHANGIHWTTDMAYVTCPGCIAALHPPASAVSPTQPKRENFLRLAHKISDIARGNDGVVDPEHDVDTCEVCGRVADLIIDFITPDHDPLSSVVSPREEPGKHFIPMTGKPPCETCGQPEGVILKDKGTTLARPMRDL